jgi:hypothetical protein
MRWPYRRTVLDPRFLGALSDRKQGTGFGLVRMIDVITGATGSTGVGIWRIRSALRRSGGRITRSP